MKKFAILMAAVTLLSASSVTAFAADINQDTPDKTSELTVSAAKGVSYTLSIPSGNATVDVAESEAQEIGKIGLTAGNFTEGAVEVTVTSANNWNLKNKETDVPYTIDAAGNKYSFAEPNAELTAVNLTVTDTAAAAIAGTYTDTLTFTADASTVK